METVKYVILDNGEVHQCIVKAPHKDIFGAVISLYTVRVSIVDSLGRTVDIEVRATQIYDTKEETGFPF